MILKRFADLPISGKLATLTVLASAVGLILASAALIAYQWVTERANYSRDLQTVSQMITANSTAALAFQDAQSAKETLAALRAKPEILLACLYAKGEEEVLAKYARSGEGRCPTPHEAPGPYTLSGSQILVSEVELDGEPIGYLRLTQTLQPLRDALYRQIVITVGIAILSFAASVGVAQIIQRSISGPIGSLAATARRVTETHDYDIRATGKGKDEIGYLVSDFNRMLDELKQARDSLNREFEKRGIANAELEDALDQLRNAQEQLVQSEKLASLGALVAGVAHEINTPVGVSVTAASTLSARAESFKQRYESNEMTRTDLDRFVQVANESTRILLTNLRRAAELIQSFKQVAVDQSSGARRRFNLNEYLDEVMSSLRPQLKRSGHEVSVNCPTDIEVDGYPGALAQILTNFVTNSLLHAYEPEQTGKLDVTAREHGSSISLVYRDDGSGMSAENLAKVFDPFFTTKRGAGGSGLGMHIVYNLVTQVLGGTITAHSKPGEGVEIHVSFPSQAGVKS